MGESRRRLGALCGEFRQFRNPLNDLATYSGVNSISTGKSFRKSGSTKGMHVSVYDPSRRTLKLSCCSDRGGGLEVCVGVNPDAVESVKRYISELHEKYFAR